MRTRCARGIQSGNQHQAADPAAHAAPAPESHATATRHANGQGEPGPPVLVGRGGEPGRAGEAAGGQRRTGPGGERPKWGKPQKGHCHRSRHSALAAKHALRQQKARSPSSARAQHPLHVRSLRGLLAEGVPIGDRVRRPRFSGSGSLLCQAVLRSEVLGWVTAGPGRGLSEEPAWGCEPVALESESFPRCPPGPVTALVIASLTMCR